MDAYRFHRYFIEAGRCFIASCAVASPAQRKARRSHVAFARASGHAREDIPLRRGHRRPPEPPPENAFTVYRTLLADPPRTMRPGKTREILLPPFVFPPRFHSISQNCRAYIDRIGPPHLGAHRPYTCHLNRNASHEHLTDIDKGVCNEKHSRPVQNRCHYTSRILLPALRGREYDAADAESQ
jgi:hypothetical protein